MPVVLTGLAANDPVPGNYVEVAFAQGETTLGNATYAACFLGNKLTTGTATDNTVIYGPTSNPPLASEDDAIALFGRGSELHRMIRAFLQVNKVTPFYAVSVAPSAGAAATRDHVVSGTATANGVLSVFIGPERIDTAITSGDVAGTIATNVVASINQAAVERSLPVTASVVTTTTIRLTARQLGPRGNWLRSMVTITANITTAVTNSASGFLASGSTADSSTTALATILPYRYYYLISAANDATQLGALVTQVNTQALPTTGIRQTVWAGTNDTIANTITLATGINGARASLAWLPDSDVEPPVMAAYVAGAVSLFEAPLPPRCNFAGFGNDALTQAAWVMPAPLSGAAPTRANLVSALNNGISPIGVNANRTTYLVDLITTRSLSGSTPDYRIRDHHKVLICDRFADDWQAKCALQFSGKLLANDPPEGARVPGPNVATPRVVKAAANKLTGEYGDLDLLQNLAAIRAGTVVERPTSPTSRISVSFPLEPIDVLKQTATFVAQVA